MDYITVDNLKINAAHGHYEQERRIEQEFVIALRVGINATPAGGSDKLLDTIDYDVLRAIVEDIFKGEPHYLLEALADEIAQKILADTIAQEVSIAIQKTAVWPNGIPGISLTRIKK
jgi:dihydroneopterin aldolase/2-amino-4-hydroxy-6-hydroxymethyldihydropteridine diphosphokinase